jgi:hypothetical protein
MRPKKRATVNSRPPCWPKSRHSTSLPEAARENRAQTEHFPSAMAGESRGQNSQGADIPSTSLNGEHPTYAPSACVGSLILVAAHSESSACNVARATGFVRQ